MTAEAVRASRTWRYCSMPSGCPELADLSEIAEFAVPSGGRRVLPRLDLAEGLFGLGLELGELFFGAQEAHLGAVLEIVIGQRHRRQAEEPADRDLVQEQLSLGVGVDVLGGLGLSGLVVDDLHAAFCGVDAVDRALERVLADLQAELLFEEERLRRRRH